MADKRTGTTGVERDRDRLPLTVLLALGMGCAIAWYLLSGTWLDGFLQTPAGDPPVGGSSLLTCATAATVLLALGCGRGKLDGSPLRLIVLIGGLAASFSLVTLVFFMSADASSTGLLRIAWSTVSGIVYGLGLCAWVQNIPDKTVRGAMSSGSLGLLSAGCLMAVPTFGLPGASACLVALPFASFALFCTAAFVARNRPGAALGKRVSQSAARSKRVPYAALYAVLMGFATTQFFVMNGSNAPGATAVCMVAASGTVLLFVSLFLINALGITWCLFLAGMLFGIVVAFWLAMPESSALVVVTTATLHWASVLLVASAAFEPRENRRSRPVPAACTLLALFYMAAGLGSLTIFIGATSRAVICMGAIVVLLLTFLLARRENAPAAPGPLPGDARANRDGVLRAFAQA